MKQVKIYGVNVLAPKAIASLAGVVVVLAALGVYTFKSSTNMNMPAMNIGTSSDMEVQATPTMKQSFVKLAAAHTDVCRDIGDKPAIDMYMNNLPSSSRLQGSCCSPMDMKKYVSQATSLKKYASISQIPPDPYDISKESAQQMLGYYNDIQLTSVQQSVYDSAQKMTADKGWCCCQCWAWYTHAGLAKYLNTQYDYTAQQLVDITNLEDCCGGAS